MPTYLCPRCGGTEMFYADRQQVVGSGYAQEVRWVKLPLCKACGERVQVILAEEEKGFVERWFNRKRSGKQKFLTILGLMFGSLALGLGLILLIMWIGESLFL